MSSKSKITDLQNQLMKLQVENARLLKENKQLKEENTYLKSRLDLSIPKANESGLKSKRPIVFDDEIRAQTRTRSREQIIKERITLFRNLFRGREDVYPVRWESKNGRSGYSPACAHEWIKPICKKPLIKCSQCEHRTYLPVTNQVIYDHLSGKHTIGVYPLLQDETCWFLAIDFDKSHWQEDCLTFIETCEEMNIPTAFERSRSGNGGHVWIFFGQMIPASLARKLGGSLLTRAMNKRHQIGLDSYDRLFPNQDTLPKGGFGNLIALPLQGTSRRKGNSIFINHNLTPFEDQWEFLSQLKKLKEEDIHEIVNDSQKADYALGFNQKVTNCIDDKEPWNLFSHSQEGKKIIQDSRQINVKVVKSNLLYIEKNDLPSKVINQIIRLAAFPNPEFYKAQAMRLPTYNKPRMITCFEEFPEHIALPRGCFEELIDLLDAHHIKADIVDEQYSGKKLDSIEFLGTLTPLQEDAMDKLVNYDHGILSATTAFGKTVIAASIIAKRQVNTLVIVHRTQLIEQWKERLNVFLDISNDLIGQVGGGKNKRTGIVDIATIQSLNQKGIVKDLVTEYGQTIVDECHHISAFSFEQVLKQAKAKYVLGLTATPTRKDGHHPIMTMQCGPIRYKVDAKLQAKTRPFEQIVIPKRTSFKLSNSEEKPIQDIYQLLIDDEERNYMIFDDLLHSLEAGRSPLFLTERTAHVDYFENKLKGFAKNIIVLRGGMGKKQRQEIFKRISDIPDEEERVLIATGKFIGEGFDDPRLDTLFLTLPISWKGTLQQYSGRLHRLHSNKKTVKIYDYVDEYVPVLRKMFEKRKKGYNAMGYNILEE